MIDIEKFKEVAKNIDELTPEDMAPLFDQERLKFICGAFKKFIDDNKLTDVECSFLAHAIDYDYTERLREMLAADESDSN